MPISKASQRAVNKYKKNNYDRIEITAPKGRRDVIKAHADARGESVNGFINRAIVTQIQRDSGRNSWDDIVDPDTLKTAQTAAQAAGEAVPAFITRAVETQARRDTLTRQMEGGKAR